MTRDISFNIDIRSKTIWSISIDVESFLKFADQITDELFLARPIVDLGMYESCNPIFLA